ncbi:MAG: S49 family peptidase [Anaerolineae bacterium]
MEENNRGRRWFILKIFLAGVALPFIFGLFLSQALTPLPQIGVIRLEDEIWSYTMVKMNSMLQYARQNKAIRAVVIEINSPGGEVSSSESLYYEVLALRKEKPVVASIDTWGASGAYYMAIAANFIYAKPSSNTGNIGLIAQLPIPSFVDEDYIFSGPFKAFGSSPERYTRQMDMSKENFLAAVLAQRGDKLKIDKETLAKGEIYLGMQAASLGLVDGIGSLHEAVKKAAELAGVSNYQVVEVSQFVKLPTPPYPTYGANSQTGDQPSAPTRLPPGLYYLYPNTK